MSEQTSQVLPAGQTRLATHLFAEEHIVVPAGHAQVLHWSTYVAPTVEAQAAPTVDVAAEQPPHGYEAVLQEQLREAQLYSWLAAHGRESDWQVESVERYSRPPKQVVPPPEVGQAHVPCVLLYGQVWAEAKLTNAKEEMAKAIAMANLRYCDKRLCIGESNESEAFFQRRILLNKTTP